jgi:Immunity protein 49
VIRLEETLYDASSYNDFLIQTLSEREEIGSSGRLCSQICRYFRAIGTCQLLIRADTDAFFHGLLRSALTWSWYLERSLLEGTFGDPARKASFVAPFADALAASRPRLAARLAELAPTEWRPDYEYEDDYLFARFLFAAARGDESSKGELAELLQRWERVLEGGEDLRLQVCEALTTRDSPGFDAAFLALVHEREARFAARADPETDGVAAYDYDFVPNWRIWVEGLALLRLAEERGLELRAEYPTCPSIARSREYAELPPSAFPPNLDEL